jgi:hypothetical protein
MKNNHIEHLEDLLLDRNDDFVLTVLSELGDLLTTGVTIPLSPLSISTKWDGSPAIVFGPDPVDGRFFVATKAAFNKVPKLAKSHEDINALYPESICTILHAALSELSTLYPGGVLQGDVLFVNDPEGRLAGSAALQGTKLTPQNIGGTKYLTFQPNTICYAVLPTSEVGQRIAAAGLGLAVHTVYDCPGKTLAQSSARNLTPDVFSALHQSPHVFVVDTQFDDIVGSVSFSQSEAADFDLSLDAAHAISPPPAEIYTVVSVEPFRTELFRYLNYTTVRKSRVPSVDDFYLYLNQRKADEVMARLTDRGRNGAVIRRFNTMLEDLMLPAVQNGLKQWFDLYRAIIRVKTIIIRKLEQVPQTDIKTFVAGDNGYQPTGPEGFVVVRGDRSVKLVDRPEFSKRNFQFHKQ